MSHQLDFITKEHILSAITSIEVNEIPKNHLWNEYWLCSQDKPYPFKYVVELASQIANHPLKQQILKAMTVPGTSSHP